MKQEYKFLLLQDLCTRLPYGVKGLHRGQVHSIKIMDASGLYPSLQVDGYDAWFPIETFKPYLRPMSSMTEEECIELGNIQATIENISEVIPNVPYYIEVAYSKQIDWLNAHHFDYRGLIEKGLALVAPDGMYN